MFVTHFAYADGTRQLMPKDESGNHKGYCYIALGSREGGNGPSREFARYNHSNGVSCGDENRLYFRIVNVDNKNNEGEIVYFGFGGLRYNGADYTSGTKVNDFPVGVFANFRIKKSSADDLDPGFTGFDDGIPDEIVYAEQLVPTTGKGYIQSYNEAWNGPNDLVKGNSGYNSLSFKPTSPGLYYIEFDIGCDFGEKVGYPLDFKWFDITIANSSKGNAVAIDGRVYSKAWGLNADGSNNEVWSSFYTYSTDHYTSKVYFSGIKPYRFVFGCNSYGARSDKTVEENRQSNPGVNSFEPEYRVFLTPPDEFVYKAGEVPNIPKDLTFAGDAITCEDLIFVVKLLANESATLELFLDLDPEENNGIDKVFIEKLDVEKNKDRGYHYPWKDRPEIKEAGHYYYYPVTEGCPREYKLSLFDQRFKNGAKVYNVGDMLGEELGVVSWDANPIGSEYNPILISSKEELEAIATAMRGETSTNTEEGDDSEYLYYYTINPFAYKAGTKEPISRTFPISAKDGFAGMYFYIVAPTGTINLDASWPGIGTPDNPFQGSMGAGRYNPDPLTDNQNEGRAELAGDQCAITFAEATHGLFNFCEGATIDNIHTEGSFVSETKVYPAELYGGFGAICGYANSTEFRYCSNKASINNTVTIDANSEITGYTGGIVGYATECVISNCENFSEISVPGEASGTAGIVGYAEDSEIKYCFNIGSVSALSIVGGIVGEDDGSSYVACRNDGAIQAEEMYAGGIVGYTTSHYIGLEECYNSGTISAESYLAGIIGGDLGLYESNVKLCVNVGSLSPLTNTLHLDDISDGTSGTRCYPTLDEISATDFVNANSSACYFDANGNVGLLETMCLGRTWRNENAGRLYSDDEAFYISWDGKYDNGDCVTGSLTVDYQKSSGVTHFPFYDPEMIETTIAHGENDNLDVLKGLVVYRISPIQDSLKDIAHGYKALPKGYYQNSNFSDSEYGIELKLFWDDRKISYGNDCTMDVRDGFVYGESVYTPAVYDLVKTSYYGTWSKCSKYYDFKDGDGSTVKVCKTLAKGATGEIFYKKVLKSQATKTCKGIENVSYGGYYGSEAGGHAFPINLFGDKNTMNTWWNGVEVHGLKKLTLKENEPAVLLSIEIASWTAKNEKNSVLLEWSTSSEENNETFQIERSFDGIHWERIGSVLGAGTTSIMHYYSFVDEEPLDGISYYRLKQIDFDGDYSYSSIKTINRKNALQNAVFKAYTREEENSFVVEGEQIAACPIAVYDVYGRLITQVSYHTITPDKVVIIVKDITAGTYVIRSCDSAKTVVKGW